VEHGADITTSLQRDADTHFTCFTGKKVQILTPLFLHPPLQLADLFRTLRRAHRLPQNAVLRTGLLGRKLGTVSVVKRIRYCISSNLGVVSVVDVAVLLIQYLSMSLYALGTVSVAHTCRYTCIHVQVCTCWTRAYHCYRALRCECWMRVGVVCERKQFVACCALEFAGLRF
jgi:hypothetical protein